MFQKMLQGGSGGESGIKVKHDMTPVCTTNWQNVDCGFKPTTLCLSLVHNATKGQISILKLVGNEYIQTSLWRLNDNLNGILIDDNVSIIIQPTDNGFKFLRGSTSDIGYGIAWEYIAILE